MVFRRIARRRVAIDARLADFAVFQFARRLYAIGGEPDRAALRKIGPAGITEQNGCATLRAIAEPFEQAFRQRPLVTHVADQNDIPVARPSDDVFGDDLDLFAAPAESDSF